MTTLTTPLHESDGSRWIAIGALLAALAVVCGAFAAHGLDGWFTRQYAGETRIVAGQEIPRAVKHLADFRTAAEYQFTHALGLTIVGLFWRQRGSTTALRVAAGSLLTGCILFSGSLYVLTLTGLTWLGAITPLGGLAFIVGWLALAAAAWPAAQPPTDRPV